MKKINRNFTLTKLRQDVISILEQHAKPLKAHEILEKLRQIRPNAQPPTVYRVLEFLEKKHVIHQLSNKHSYVLCDSPDSAAEHEVDILLTCKNCDNFIESHKNALLEQIKTLTKHHKFKLACSAIEILGLCKDCK